MSATVRDIVREAQKQLIAGDLQPTEARLMMQHLSSLLGNCNDEIRAADAAYSLVLLAHLESEEKANRAKIRAETTPEYARKRTARDTKELVVEMIRSLKYLLRSYEEEARLGGHQT